MKKTLVLIATGLLLFCLGACERHPAGQLPKEGEGAAAEKTDKSAEKQATPEASPGGTPKTYFPQAGSDNNS